MSTAEPSIIAGSAGEIEDVLAVLPNKFRVLIEA